MDGGATMSMTVGVREFRQDVADDIDQPEPVTVTRHGQTVGLFIPVHRDRKAEVAAYVEAAKKANALLTELGTTEDEVVAEFEALRKSESS
jgi:antitoxin (DNA-binding transcriptional repressor) of toxin-antitoxin stability system